MVLKSMILEGFLKAKMQSNIDVGIMIFKIFFECVFVLIFDGGWDAPKIL